MDYFSELLHSYTKLKKRTFKLTYINEQAEGGESIDSLINTEEGRNLLQILNSAPEFQPNSEPQPIPQIPKYQYKRTKDGSVTVFAGNYQNVPIINQGGQIATTKTGGQPLGSQAVSKQVGAIKLLIKALKPGGDQEEAPEEEPTQQEQQPQTPEEQAAAMQAEIQMHTPGNSLAMVGAGAGSLENITNSAKYIQGMTGTDWFKAEIANKRSTLTGIADNVQAFIDPTSPHSFEYKLTNGVSIALNADGDFAEQPLNPALIYEATRSNDLLMSFLEDDISEDKCNFIQYRVGQFDKTDSNKLVFFGSNSNEGIVVNANPIQKVALLRMKQKCEGASLEVIKVGETKEKYLNDLRGKLAEHTLLFVSRLANPETRELAIKEFKQYLFTRRRQYLKAAQFFSERVEIGSLDLEAAGFGQASQELSNIFNDSLTTKALLSVIGQSMFKIYKEARPDGVRHIGKQVSTGGEDTDVGTKGDIIFQYTDQARALEYAQRTGAVPVLNPETGLYEVSISQKFLQKIDDSNAGEVKGTMSDHYNGQMRGSLDLLPKIDSKLYADRAEASASLKLFNDIEQKIQKTIQIVEQDQGYFNTTGKLKIENAKDVCNNLVKILKQKLPFDVKDSELLGTIKADYSHEENRKRIAEYLSRRLRIQKYSELTKSEDKQTAMLAAKTLLRMSAITAYAKDDAVTYLATEQGDLVTFKTNNIYDSLFESMNNGTFDPASIEYTLAGIKFTSPQATGKAPMQLTFKSEGFDKENQRGTIFKTKISKGTMLSMARVISQGISSKRGSRRSPAQEVNAETLYKFMRGQMDLLEELLKITR